MTNQQQGKKPVTRKPRPGNGEAPQGAPEQQPDMILAVVVPGDVYKEILDSLEELPRKRTALLWKHLDTLQPQMVPVNRG